MPRTREQHYPSKLIHYSYCKKIIRRCMEKFSLLTEFAKCTLNIALKLTFSVFLFFFVFWLHFRPPRHCLKPFFERQFFTQMTEKRREEFSSLYCHLAFKSWPCLRQKSLISLPCLRQETLVSDPDLFCFVYRIIGIANVDRSSQVFTLFERLPFQKDTLLKTPNSEIVYPVEDSRSWKSNPASAEHTRIGQIKECPLP